MAALDVAAGHVTFLILRGRTGISDFLYGAIVV